MLKKFSLNKSIILVLDIILLIVSISCYVFVFEIEKGKNSFAADAEQFAQEIHNPLFSEEGTLQNIDISQFTDIAVYIDNKGRTEEITAENTINEMFIDNIKITIPSESGEHIFNYKNCIDGCKMI